MVAALSASHGFWNMKPARQRSSESSKLYSDIFEPLRSYQNK
jgi:hypothetical protein